MTKYYTTIFNIFALTLCIYIGVDIFYRIVDINFWQVKKAEIVYQHSTQNNRTKKEPLSGFKIVSERSLFGSQDKPDDKKLDMKGLDTLDPTSLKIALLGTVTGDKKNICAIIKEQGSKKEQGIYRVGDSIQNAFIKMILRGKVILRVGNKDEILTIQEVPISKKRRSSPPRAVRRRSSTIDVDRAKMENPLENMNDLLSKVRIKPHFRNGKPDGLSVIHVEDGSIFSSLGLERGDIIKGVNGKAVSGPDDLVELYSNLKAGSDVSLEMLRNGESKTLTYRFR